MQPLKLSSATQRQALVVVLIATFLGGLDTYIVNLSLPTIARALRTDIGTVEWVVLAYLLAITGLVVSFGRAADIWGTKRVFIAGLLTFSLGSALGGLAPGVGWLVGFRGLQGIGAAMLLATGQALIAEIFGEGERGRAMGWMHAAVAAGFTAGPTVGGWLLEQTGWRAIFFVSVPIGLMAAAVAARVLPAVHQPREGGRHFDITGAVTLSLGLVALLLPLTFGQKAGWLEPTVIVSLFLGVIFFVVFIAVERRTSQPLVAFDLFRNWAFSAGLLATFLTFVAMASNMFLMPFLLQNEMGLSAWRAGLVMIAVPLTILWVAPIGGRLADQYGPRGPATAGLGLVTFAIGLMAGLGADSSSVWAAAVLALYGAGAGLFQSPNNSAVMGAAPPDRRGVASGTLVTARQLGQTLGVAVAGALWVGRRDVHAVGLPPETALALGFRDAFWGLALIGLLAVIVSWLRGPRTAKVGFEKLPP